LNDKRVSLRQRLKNAYVELRFGLDHYNFPWELRKFAAMLVAFAVGMAAAREMFIKVLQACPNRPPVQYNFKWENTDIYDILWYTGVRKNSTDSKERGMKFPTNNSRRRPRSSLEIAGMHHMPKRAKKTKSEYSHTIYSNTRSRTLKKNKERHREFVKERKKEKKRVEAWKKECKEKEAELQLKELSKKRRQMRAGEVVR